MKLYENTFYNFYRDGVTQSMMGLFQRCPKQCEIAYANGWTQIERFNPNLLFGNICHYVLEEAYSSIQPPLPGNIKSLVRGYELLDENQRIYNNLPADSMRDWDTCFAKAETLMQCYFIHHTKDFEHNWEFTEKIFKVPYVFPDGSKTFITGKIDGGFQTTNNANKLELMDHKFMSQINVETVLTLLPADHQVNTYLWCMTQLYPELDLGTFHYNICRNPGIKINSKKGESVQAYQERLYSKIMDDKYYYFLRKTVHISKDEILEWGATQLAGILRDMRHWFDTNYAWPGYYNAELLRTPYGTLSDYAEAILYDDYSKFYKRPYVFTELQ